MSGFQNIGCQSFVFKQAFHQYFKDPFANFVEICPLTFVSFSYFSRKEIKIQLFYFLICYHILLSFREN